MDNTNNFYAWWKKNFIDMLFRVVAEVMFFWRSSADVRIPGFMNIEHRRRIRLERWNARRDLEKEWGDTPECHQDNEVNGWKYHDIFELRRLFYMQNLDEEIDEINFARYEEEQARREEEIRLINEAWLRDRELWARLREQGLLQRWIRKRG